MITPRMLDYMECAARVFPGWVKTCDQNGVSKINRVEFAWRLMPKSFLQVRNVLTYGHPRGVEGILREANRGVR